MIRTILSALRAWFAPPSDDELYAELSARAVRAEAEAAALRQKIADDAVIDAVLRREVAEARADAARRRGQN